MQTSVPELTDFSDEPESVLEMYGPQVREPGTFAYNCLMARRLAERGVPFVQCMHAGWDQHRSAYDGALHAVQGHGSAERGAGEGSEDAGDVRRYLVIWGGEFGRTPFIQGDFKDRKGGVGTTIRTAFTVWMAGGGVKPGIDLRGDG